MKKFYQIRFLILFFKSVIKIFLILYFCFRLSFSQFTGNRIEKPYQFLGKVIVISICINFSTFLCEELLKINGLFTDSIRMLGNAVTKQDISFNNLITSSIYLTNSPNNFNLFSLEGMLKSFFSIGLISLLFSYSIRYILIKLFVLLSPFALLSLVNSSTIWFFKSWMRTLFSLLFVQVFISLILVLLFSLNIKSSDLFSQISYISTIFILTKANGYIKELIGGISLDINANILNIKNLFR